VTSDGLGCADPPAGARWLCALAPVCFAERSPALGASPYRAPQPVSIVLIVLNRISTSSQGEKYLM